ncbi:MAG: RNA methyltransferase [Phycisphaerales bacterium]|nr:RNA methyltransferase [Phycisphaerales bacterium]
MTLDPFWQPHGDVGGAPTGITDVADPRILSFRSVRDGDLRGRDGLFCVESPRIVRRFLHALVAADRGAIISPRVELRGLFVTPRTLDSLGALMHLARSRAENPPRCPLFVAEESLMTQVSGYEMHKGAMALGVRPSSASFDNLLEACGPCADLLIPSGVVLTDNIGAIFRNAGSLGGCGVLLTDGSSDPLHRKSIRISAGRVFTIPWGVTNDWQRDLMRLKHEHGFALIAAEDGPDAVDIDEALQQPTIQSAQRVAVILGAEGAGVAPSMRALCDATVVIPMATPNQLMESTDQPSLNVAVASALFLHRIRSARRHARPRE